ncbi:MAG: hypothetical protein WCG27_00895, partial [Pseudomonadota bacterium]
MDRIRNGLLVLLFIFTLGLPGFSQANSQYQKVVDQILKQILTDNPERDLIMMAQLKDMAFSEVGTALYMRYMNELERGEIVPNVLYTTIAFIGTSTGQDFLDKVQAMEDGLRGIVFAGGNKIYDREMRKLFRNTRGRLEQGWNRTPRVWENVDQAMLDSGTSIFEIIRKAKSNMNDKLRKEMEERNKQNPPKLGQPTAKSGPSVAGNQKLLGMKDYRRRNQMTIKDWMKDISDTLNARVIGQPELVKNLLAMEFRNSVYGNRITPEVQLLMGSPGTGKDTTAQAYTDAIHGFKGAYREHMYVLPVLKKDADLWSILGSATGYVGSTNFPPFLTFLIEHSGGRYILKEKKGAGDKTEYYV